MTSTEIFSGSGGPRRWPPRKLRFPDNGELQDLIESLAERVEELEGAVSESHEPDLYVEPLTPLEEYKQGIIICKEWQKNASELWQTIYRETVDMETVAFYMLSDEAREQLRN